MNVKRKVEVKDKNILNPAYWSEVFKEFQRFMNEESS